MLLFSIYDKKITKFSRKNRFTTVASPGACERLAVLNWHHHHHNNRHPELVSDVVVSASVCQAVLFWARRWAVTRPRLSGHRSAILIKGHVTTFGRRSFSIVRNQVCLGRSGLLQCLGRPVVLAYSAREWSWQGSALQMWPKKRRHLERTASDSNGCWVLERTSLLMMRCVQCIFRIRRKHHWSRASNVFAGVAVTDQVSAPYRKIGRMQEL